MLESYKLKKAKAKLELESVNRQLNEIEVKKENERWEQMPQWEKNIEIEKLRVTKTVHFSFFMGFGFFAHEHYPGQYLFDWNGAIAGGIIGILSLVGVIIVFSA